MSLTLSSACFKRCVETYGGEAKVRDAQVPYKGRNERGELCSMFGSETRRAPFLSNKKLSGLMSRWM